MFVRRVVEEADEREPHEYAYRIDKPVEYGIDDDEALPSVPRAKKRARRKAKCVRFARDDAGDEGFESGHHSEGSGDRAISDPGIEPSSKWTKAEFLHELLKGSGGVDGVLAALRREIDSPDDVQAVRTWVDVLGKRVGTSSGIPKPSASIIEGDDTPALDELLLG